MKLITNKGQAHICVAKGCTKTATHLGEIDYYGVTIPVKLCTLHAKQAEDGGQKNDSSK